MVFRDDRDALLAQADALRVQLAETEQQLEDARRVAADAKAAGLGSDDDDPDEARLKQEVARLRDQVESLRETNAKPKPVTAPPRVEPALPTVAPPAEVFGSVIRGPAPELPPAGNPAMAIVAFLLILVVVGAFAALAFSG